MNNELALTNSSAGRVLATELFSDINFDTLNDAINRLGDESAHLEDEARKNAVVILDDWQHRVIERINHKYNNLTSFLRFFDTPQGYSSLQRELFEEIGEKVAVLTHTEAAHAELARMWDALDALYQTKPARFEADLELSQLANDRLEAEQRLEHKRWDNAMVRGQRALWLKWCEWVQVLVKHADIKDMLKRGRHFTKNVGLIRNDCIDKGELAKMNVMVGNANLRATLRELLEFGKNI